MSRHRHRKKNRDTQRLLVTVMCALLGLTFGFAGGRFFPSPFGNPKAGAEVSAGKPAEVKVLPAAGAPLVERMAAADLMDEDSLTGLLAAVNDEHLRGVAKNDPDRLAMLYLRIIFSRWTDLNPTSALKAALGLKHRWLSNEALGAVMTEWALRDTQVASQSLTLIPWAASRERAIAALMRAGVQRSPAEALAITDKITLVPQNLMRRAAGAEWMRRDAGHALRFLTERPGIGGTIPAGLALGQWLMDDPAAFTAWRRGDQGAATAIPLVRIPPDTLTSGRLTRLHMALLKEFGSAGAGAAWLSGAAGPSARAVTFTLAPDTAVPIEQNSWTERAAALPDAATPAGWLARLARARTLRRLASLHAAIDPAAVLQWLAALPPDEEAWRLSPAVAEKWLVQAPATAPEKLAAGDLANPVWKAAVTVTVNSMMRSDPLRSLQMLPDLKLPPEAARLLQSAALRELALSAPDAMLEWLEKHPGTELPPGSIATALKSAAAGNARRAIDWTQKHAPPAKRPALIADIFGIWLQKDRSEALEFLSFMAAGNERNAAIEQLVSNDTAMTDPFFAANMLPDCFEQALHHSSGAERIAALRRVLRRMQQLQIAPEPSLAHRSLLPADRQELLKNP
jgi:hypothetical protein